MNNSEKTMEKIVEMCIRDRCVYFISSLTRRNMGPSPFALVCLQDSFNAFKQSGKFFYWYTDMRSSVMRGFFSELVCWLIYAQLHYYRKMCIRDSL